MSKIEQLRLNGQLPSPKGVALAIMELCRREDASIEAVTRVVQTDPALAARLLRLANAAALRAARPVAAVPDAVMRLGMAAVRQVAMGFSMVDQHRHGQCEGFDYDRFWSHSLLMAVAMQALAARSRAGSPEEMFTCGLMARIGCLALATVYPAEYAALLRQNPNERDLAALERQHLRADHHEFTAAILEDCGVPHALIEPVIHHEDPDTSGFTEGSRPHRLAHLFHHGKRIADMGLAPETERSGLISELMLLGGKLGLDANEQGSLIDGIVAEWRQWSELLKVPAGALPSFAAMAAAPAPKNAERQAMHPSMRVLLVEDEPASRMLMEKLLADIVGPNVHSATNGSEALALALEIMPQIVVTDWLMPVMDGVEFCKALRATDWGQSMYVIMLTGVDNEDEVTRAFEAGVDDYVTKPLKVRSLRARMRAALHYVQLLDAWESDRAKLKQFTAELAISNRKLEHYAMTDLLTGLPNRRAGMDVLGQAWSGASRSGHGLAVMMIDIDRFKGINDTHGHAVGDKVLTRVGKLIRASARRDDHVSRIGGEEFLVICHNADLQAVLHAAERLRQKVGSEVIEADGVGLKTSISIGVASKKDGMTNADALIAAADRALYAAKQNGRDRTCLNAGGKLMLNRP
ncbi:MAG: HDOD domain-containing protein [Rhodocyclaceae bacterium]|nr:HDOD domain-containing protein [Rhodocyclaceae bacterium]